MHHLWGKFSVKYSYTVNLKVWHDHALKYFNHFKSWSPVEVIEGLCVHWDQTANHVLSLPAF